MLVFGGMAHEGRIVREQKDPVARLGCVRQVLLEPGTLGGLPFQAGVQDGCIDDHEVEAVLVEGPEGRTPLLLEHGVEVVGHGRDCHKRVGIVADVVVAGHEVDRVPKAFVDPGC